MGKEIDIQELVKKFNLEKSPFGYDDRAGEFSLTVDEDDAEFVGAHFDGASIEKYAELLNNFTVNNLSFCSDFGNKIYNLDLNLIQDLSKVEKIEFDNESEFSINLDKSRRKNLPLFLLRT